MNKETNKETARRALELAPAQSMISLLNWRRHRRHQLADTIRDAVAAGAPLAELIAEAEALLGLETL